MTKTYITIQGDTWDVISFKVYGNEQHMDVLIQANSQHIQTVIFPANVSLTVPTLDIPVTTQLPPWKRGGASE